MSDAVIAGCASEGGSCTCEAGGTVIYGMQEAGTGKLNIAIQHYEMDAEMTGST